jgi:hypothetical protein
MESDRIERLERKVRRLSILASVLAAGFAILGLSAFSIQQGRGILRTRGIIVEDDKGRERILIGAPIPPAKNRVRTDIARVQKEWAPRFPDSARYMGFYKNYRHTMHGLLVLDENGHDRLALGDSTPDPNIGRRIGPGTGIQINNGQGFERSGYSLLNVNGVERVVLGLDSKQGREGLTLALDDAGRVQVMVRDGDKMMLLGTLSPTDQVIEGTRPEFGVVVRDGNQVRHRVVTGQR